ncbi:MAG: hypothetical protein ALAOOOJD_00070 [bacterium]|nr:hypothetical protein [bacterium]
MQLEKVVSFFMAHPPKEKGGENASITESDLQAALNKVLHQSLQPVAMGLGVLYFILALCHVLMMPKLIALPMSLTALGTGMALLSLRWALQRWPLDDHWAHPIGAGIAGIILLNCLLHLYYVPEPQQTTNLLLLIIGAGFIILSTSWLTLIILTTLLGWSIFVWLAPSSPNWLHFGFALYMATVLSVLVHTVRVRNLTGHEILRLHDERRTAELETALRATEAARRDAEAITQDLMQNEARLRLLTNQMPAVLWTTDTELRVTSSLGMGLTALGLQPQEILEMMRLKYSSAMTMEFLPSAAHRRALAGESVSYEINWKGHGFGCRVGPLYDVKKSLIGTIGIAFDISGQKQAEEEVRQLNVKLEQSVQMRTAELRASEERYRMLYEDNPSMYFTVDASGEVLSVNQFGAQQLGYTVNELVGQSVLKVFYDEDKAHAASHLERCLQNPGKIHTWELRKVRRNGSLLWVRETARANRGANGEFVVFIVCEDMTSHKRLEEEIRQYTDRAEFVWQPGADFSFGS